MPIIIAVALLLCVFRPLRQLAAGLFVLCFLVYAFKGDYKTEESPDAGAERATTIADQPEPTPAQCESFQIKCTDGGKDEGQIGDRVKVEYGCVSMGAAEHVHYGYALEFSDPEIRRQARASGDEHAWHDAYLMRLADYQTANCNVSSTGIISERRKSRLPSCIDQKAEAIEAGKLEFWDAGGYPPCDGGDFFRVTLDNHAGDVWGGGRVFISRSPNKPQPVCRKECS